MKFLSFLWWVLLTPVALFAQIEDPKDYYIWQNIAEENYPKAYNMIIERDTPTFDDYVVSQCMLVYLCHKAKSYNFIQNWHELFDKFIKYELDTTKIKTSKQHTKNE